MTRILLADQTDHGLDLGSGTTLPTSRPGGAALVRGDAYFHTGLACLMSWTGTAWRQVDVPQLANTAAMDAISTNHSAALYAGFEVVIGQDVRCVWTGTVWRKIGGSKTRVTEVLDTASTTTPATTAASVRSTTFSLTYAGYADLMISTEIASSNNGAVYLWLNINGTSLSRRRYHNHSAGYGVYVPVFLYVPDYLLAAGTHTIQLHAAHDSAGTAFTVWETLFEVYA